MISQILEYKHRGTVYPQIFKPPISLYEIETLLKVTGLDQTNLILLLIEIFSRRLRVDLYSRLRLDELSGSKNRPQQGNFLIQQGFLSMSGNCLLDDDDKVRFYNQEAQTLLQKIYIKLLNVQKPSLEII